MLKYKKYIVIKDVYWLGTNKYTNMSSAVAQFSLVITNITSITELLFLFTNCLGYVYRYKIY